MVEFLRDYHLKILDYIVTYLNYTYIFMCIFYRKFFYFFQKDETLHKTKSTNVWYDKNMILRKTKYIAYESKTHERKPDKVWTYF